MQNTAVDKVPQVPGLTYLFLFSKYMPAYRAGMQRTHSAAGKQEMHCTLPIRLCPFMCCTCVFVSSTCANHVCWCVVHVHERKLWQGGILCHQTGFDKSIGLA